MNLSEGHAFVMICPKCISFIGCVLNDAPGTQMPTANLLTPSAKEILDGTKLAFLG